MADVLHFPENQIAASPAEAVMEALSKSYQRQISIRGKEGKCWDASVDTLCDLAMNSPEMFRNLFVLSTEDISKNSWLRRSGHSFQAYFLAEDVNGNWYAGSPSNYYATTLFKEKSLDQILKDIEGRDSLNVGDAVSISQKISDQGSFSKLSKNECKILEIRKKGSRLETKFHKFSFKNS